MKTYKDENNNLWAYEDDGSQDHLISENLIQITEEEANIIGAEIQAKVNAEFLKNNPQPQPTLEELQAQLNAIQEQIKGLGA
jgi:hypothetical protein